MSDGTGIEWTDATWNVVIGCDKVSDGCTNCYAIRTAHRMQGNPNPKVREPYAGTESGGEWTGRVNLVEDRLTLPLRWKRPRRIFVNAQSDLFHDSVPDEFIAQVWGVMAWAPWHTFQILTKRHARMRSLISSREFLSMVDDAWYAAGKRYELDKRWWQSPGHPYDRWPLPNVWLGVSTENQMWADIRIPALLGTPAAVRFISAEPLLGPIDLAPWLSKNGAQRAYRHHHTTCGAGQGGCYHPPCRCDCHRLGDNLLRWVITGGESGHNARPAHLDWFRSIRDQCRSAEVAYLHKQHGEWVPESMLLHGANAPAAFLSTRGQVRPLFDGKPAAPPMARGDDMTIRRVGKHLAGRHLDGRTWDGYPEAVVAHA